MILGQGVVGEWGLWSGCSASCGYGMKMRYRKCSVPDGCNGDLADKKLCADRLCLG